MINFFNIIFTHEDYFCIGHVKKSQPVYIQFAMALNLAMICNLQVIQLQGKLPLVLKIYLFCKRLLSLISFNYIFYIYVAYGSFYYIFYIYLACVFRWLESTLREETLDQAWFVDSLWYSFMQTMPSERALRNYFGRVDLSSRVFTFFPIVDE